MEDGGITTDNFGGTAIFCYDPDGMKIEFHLRWSVEELKQVGVRVYWSLEKTRVCYLAIVEDPDGNRVIIHQRKDKTVGWASGFM